jgi:hypothetical protein
MAIFPRYQSFHYYNGDQGDMGWHPMDQSWSLCPPAGMSRKLSFRHKLTAEIEIEAVYRFTVFMMLQMRQWMKWTATYLCNAYASAIGVLRQQLRDFLEVDHPEVIRIRHANYEL